MKAAAAKRDNAKASVEGNISGVSPPRNTPPPLCEDERQFLDILNEDLAKINAYFIEREEDAVIKLQALEERLTLALSGVQHNAIEKLKSDIVDFHGEIVLLLHWSLVNYAGVAKILKKHDKLLGGHSQEVLLQSVLTQPFRSTECLTQLARKVEGYVKQLESIAEPQEQPEAVRNDLEQHQTQQEQQQQQNEPIDAILPETGGSADAPMLQRTKAALGMLQRLQDDVHTPSTLPLTRNKSDDGLVPSHDEPMDDQ